MLYIVGHPKLKAYILLDTLGTTAINKMLRGNTCFGNVKVSGNRRTIGLYERQALHAFQV
jgi:hypothetical protein